jgi:RHS repeat-associated protein
MSSSFIKSVLLSFVFAAFTQGFADPQALTQTTFSYQSNGDPAGQTLSWADGRQVFQLNNIRQQSAQVLYNDPKANPLCHTELPKSLQSITADLICLSQTHYLQPTATLKGSQGPEPITSLAYIDSRTGKVSAKVDPMGNVTGYQYDQLGRTTAITYTYHVGQADPIKTAISISYLNANNSANQTGYNQVVVTYANGVEQRTLTNGLGQVVAKQVNTYPDGTATSADYTPGALMPAGQLRTLSSASYTQKDILQPQAQSRTDALGATTHYQYDALGRQIGVTTTQQSAITDNSPVTVTRGVIYDPVNRLQVSYQQVAGSVSPGDAHVVQVKYFNASGKVIHTLMIPVYPLQQTIGQPANTLFTSNRLDLLSCLVGIKNHSGPCAQIKSWRQTTRYNTLLQKQQVTGSLQQATYTYNDRGLVDTMTSQKMVASANKLAQPTHPLYQSHYQYNLLGKVIRETLTAQSSAGSAIRAEGAETNAHTGATHNYNSLGELTNLASTQTNPQKKPLLSSGFTYNKDGQLTRRTNVDVNTGGTISQITYYRTYNNDGQPVASWDVKNGMKGGLKEWTYYPPGNSEDQPAGKLESMAFGDPDNPDTITYSYYLDGALKQIRYADGLTINYQYNAQGQTTQVSYRQYLLGLHGGVIRNQSHYQYGNGTAHQLLKVTCGTAQVSYQYNDQGNPVVIQRTDGAGLSVTTDKTYNGYDLAASSTLKQNGQLQQQVNNLYTQGQLTQVMVSHPQIAKTNSDYSQFNYTKNYSYDGLNRLVTVTTSAMGGSPLKTVHYTFDLNNNTTRITTEDYSKSQQQQVDRHYNTADQLISQTTNNGVATNYHYNAGNVTQGPKGGTYQYNSLNQLVSYSPASTQGAVTDHAVHYQYYPNGALQSESQVQANGQLSKLTFYYSGNQIARVVDSQGNWTSYLGGLTREGVIDHHRASGKNQVEFYAYQGKTPSGWLGQGNTTWQQRNPYGLSEAIYSPVTSNPSNPLSLKQNPRLIGFNGNYQDPISHNVFMGAGTRAYNPSLGRFLQLDSYDVPNRYAYAQDNPIEKYDPSGHMAKWLKWLFVGLSVVGVAASIFTMGTSAAFLYGGIFGYCAGESVSAGISASFELASGVTDMVGNATQLASQALDLAGKKVPFDLRLTSYAALGIGITGSAVGLIGAYRNAEPLLDYSRFKRFVAQGYKDGEKVALKEDDGGETLGEAIKRTRGNTVRKLNDFDAKYIRLESLDYGDSKATLERWWKAAVNQKFADRIKQEGNMRIPDLNYTPNSYQQTETVIPENAEEILKDDGSRSSETGGDNDYDSEDSL